jgi:hypothetical protein
MHLTVITDTSIEPTDRVEMARACSSHGLASLIVKPKRGDQHGYLHAASRS